MWASYHAIGTVLQSYTDPIHPNLILEKDQTVVIIEKHIEWYRGYKVSLDDKTHELFIFPCNHIHINAMIDVSIDQEMNRTEWDQMAKQAEAEQSLIKDIPKIVKDWFGHLIAFLNAQNYSKYNALLEYMNQLMQFRQIILLEGLSFNQVKKLKYDIVDTIQKGNGLVGKEMFLRDEQNGSLVMDYDFMKMYHLHSKKFKHGQSLDQEELPIKDSVMGIPAKKKLQLYLKLKNLSGFNANECLYITFGIMSGSSKEFITHPFKLFYSSKKTGNKDSLNHNSTLFIDLEESDCQNEMYLVCRISHIDQFGMNRPLGNGIRPLGSIFNGKSQCDIPIHPQLEDYVIPIIIPAHESDWSLYSQWMNSDDSNSTNLKAGVFQMTIGLCAFHGDFDSISNSYSSIIKSLYPTRKLIDSDPKSVNQLHLVLKSADLSHYKKNQNIQNIVVKLFVRNYAGEFLSCIKDGSSDTLLDCTETVMYANAENLVWDQFLSLDLNPEIFLKSHLYNTFYCLSPLVFENQTFAFAFLPLYASQTAPIGNGGHTLSLYKYDEALAVPSVYMTLPAGPSIFVPAGLASASVDDLKTAAEIISRQNPKLKDTVLLSTQLDSSALTQNPILLNFLNWKSFIKNQRGNIVNLLQEFEKIEDQEIIKFNKSILKALYEMLETPFPNIESSILNEAIVSCLVVVLSSTNGTSRFQYSSNISTNTPLNAMQDPSDNLENLKITFKGSAKLYSVLEKYLKDPSDAVEAKKLRSLIKVWGPLFKIIISPFVLIQDEQEKGRILVNSFISQISNLLHNLNSEIALASQILVIQNFHGLLIEWQSLFSHKELLDISVLFMTSMVESNPKFYPYRLFFIKQFVHGPVFQHESVQVEALRIVISWISCMMKGKSFTSQDKKSLKGLEFATQQRRMDLKQNIDFIMEMMESLSTWKDISPLTDLLFVIINCFVKFSEWNRLRNYKQDGFQSSKMNYLNTPLPDMHSVFQGGPGDGREAFDNSMETAIRKTKSQNDQHSQVLVNMAAITLSILQRVPQKDLKLYFINSTTLNKNVDVQDSFAKQWIYVLMSVLTSDLFPRSWLIVSCAARVSIQKALEIVGEYLIQYTTAAGTCISSTSINFADRNNIQEQENWYQLWTEFFRCCLSLIHIHHSEYIQGGLQHQIVLNQMGSQLITSTCSLVKDAWEFTSEKDEYKPIALHLIPGFVGPFLEMALTRNEEMTSTGVNILFSMILLDFERDGNFSRVQDIIFEQMPWIMEKRVGNHSENLDIQIVKRLESLFATAEIQDTQKAEFKGQGRDFMSFLSTFLSLISEIHDSTSGFQNEDEKIDAMMKMIQFLGSNKINRPSMMFQFIQSLYDLHLSLENHIEAGMLLKCFADSFNLQSLSPNTFSESDNASSSSSFGEQREDIYIQCLELFERGNAWERAIEVCKVLQDLCIKNLDYSKWSMILRRQADLADKITSQERYYANYYRVSFYGNGFPSRIRGKNYVYKGLEWEKLGSFCDRILNRYPGSRIIQSVPTSTENEHEDQDRLIHVTWIDPLVDSSLNYTGQSLWPELILVKQVVADTSSSGPQTAQDIILSSENNKDSKLSRMLSYHKANETSIFCCTRPVKRVLDDNALAEDVKECLSLFTQHTIIYSQDRFPCLRKRSPVIATHTILMNPIENAILAIKKKTIELEALHTKYSCFIHDEPEPSPTTTARFSQFSSSDNSSSLWKRTSTISSSAASVNASPFTMSLNGAIDAPVNGGIPTYKKAFFTEYYKSKLEEEGKLHLLEMLQQVIDDQVLLLYKCLNVHHHVVSNEMRPLHNELISLFNKNFAEEITRINVRPLKSIKEYTNQKMLDSHIGSFNTSSLKLMLPHPDLRKSGSMLHSPQEEDFKRDSKRLTALDSLCFDKSKNNNDDDELYSPKEEDEEENQISGNPNSDRRMSIISSKEESLHQIEKNNTITKPLLGFKKGFKNMFTRKREFNDKLQ